MIVLVFDELSMMLWAFVVVPCVAPWCALNFRGNIEQSMLKSFVPGYRDSTISGQQARE